MATESTLPIRGYRDEPVPNRLLRPQEARDHLAVLLPGFGYTLDMPLFSHAENLLLERGWDVLRVEYAYNRHPEYAALPESERARWLFDDVTAAYRAGCAQRDYAGVALIGKSLGTRAMGHLLALPRQEQPTAVSHAVWLTPLIGKEGLREQIGRYRGTSLFVIGTADPHYDPRILDALLTETAGEAVVVEGADHGMDIPGDPVASARALERFVAALGRFL